MNRLFHPHFLLLKICLIWFHLVTLSALTTAAEQPAAEQPSTYPCKLIFKNSDQITAKLTRCSKTRLYFTTDYLAEETSVKLSLLREIKLTSVLPPTKSKAQHKAHLTLQYTHPSDELQKISEQISGIITQITDKEVTINTSFTKPITVPLNTISDLTIEDTSIITYDHPYTIKNWHQHLKTNHWSIENYNLISNGPDHISKDIKLSNLNHLSFYLDNDKNNYNNLTLHLFSNQPSKDPALLDSHYELRILNTSITLKKQANGRYSPLNKTYPERIFKTDQLNKFDIYSDLKKGKFYLYGDNKLLVTYTDPSPNPKLYGTKLHLISYQQPQKVSRLKSSRWNGTKNSTTESKPPRLLADPMPNGKDFILQNGDIIHGVLKGFKNEILEIQTQPNIPDSDPQSSALPSTLRVPLRGLRHLISNQTNATTKHKISSKTVQATYNNGNKIFLTIESIKGNTLQAIHPVFGNIECDLRAFSRIEFIYKL